MCIRDSPDWACLATVGTEENIARWRGIVLPILEQYQDSTDGSYIRDKKTSVVWDYRDADPDFGAWQAKELMDHLESVLVNDPVDVSGGRATSRSSRRGSESPPRWRCS